ncbi:type III PLP-dependent enzyme [Amycolatopsis albispora]|uniref:ornithine decarboxylase n=1 Tax=Amycolatopsis albispora TaxID=1804986 RepID=A0A344L748_9PSEU|nr:type III PLP-dependent enzyme [Amycolatopsis albispora]AXB43872.1 ornithine decarboxylase [Amycolatopsis albispora]
MSADRILDFLERADPPTPCLVLDVDVVRDRYRELSALFDKVSLYYAVKANPEPAVVRALVAAGSRFDVASPAEIELCLACGARPESLSYGNTIKKPADIAVAYAAGVRDFVFDAEEDLENLARHAPGSSVSVRILVDGPDSVTPFGRKFGCEPELALILLKRAAALGLDAAGVAFHVGSQQLDPRAWDAGIAAAAKIAAEVPVRRLNLGGGLGITYREHAPAPADYADAIFGSLRRHFPDGVPELLMEPGRALVAPAGLIRTEVVLVARKSTVDETRWVYLDVGRYNGLAETENEAIAYRLVPVGEQSAGTGPVIVAGPTCDGDDVLYQRTPYRLPLSLRGGDRLDILDAGAYTASYSSVAFNGIPPLRTYCLGTGVEDDG